MYWRMSLPIVFSSSRWGTFSHKHESFGKKENRTLISKCIFVIFVNSSRSGLYPKRHTMNSRSLNDKKVLQQGDRMFSSKYRLNSALSSAGYTRVSPSSHC